MSQRLLARPLPRPALPGALRLADAFQRFGDRRHAAMIQARRLSGAGQWLCLDARLTWYASGDPAIAREVGRDAERDGVSLTPFGFGIVVHDLTQIERGLMRAALRMMSVAARRDRVAEMAQRGEILLGEARRAVRDGVPANAFPELIAIKRICDRAAAAAEDQTAAKALILEALARLCQEALTAIGERLGVTAHRIPAHVVAAYMPAPDEIILDAVLAADAGGIDDVLTYAGAL